jgi:membrane-bound lytic murein transglycosylase B
MKTRAKGAGILGAAMILLMAVTGCAHEPASRAGDANRERLAFAREMSAKHGFDTNEVLALLNQADWRQDILDAIARPAESKPWHSYRPIFLTDQRIDAGVAFWREHAQTLEQAEQIYGVPAAVILAILGVETSYGSFTGRHRVLDALTTLTFGYPPRAGFFRGELEALLLLEREQPGLNLFSAQGSYAGAMGMAQFIPSSYRHYAVDFDHDGDIDLWSADDAIGSIANYLAAHSWRRGQAVAVPANPETETARAMAGRKLAPEHTVRALRERGVWIGDGIGEETAAGLLALRQPDGMAYWVTFHNFYVITRYNRSPLYAMAVHQLSTEIERARGR